MATGQQTRWLNTVYYTADTSASRAECRSRPAWAGLPCWAGPAAQPATGQQIPTTSYGGYSRDLASTRVVINGASGSSTAAKVQVAQYDAAGRSVRSATSTTGTTDQSVPATTTGYSSATGLPTTVSNGDITLTTGYDSWGRITSQTDGAGNTALTTYNAAGEVATLNDGKGTYAYGYNETFPGDGKAERRTVPTSVDLGIAGIGGATARLRADYDADGNIHSQVFPGPNPATEYRRYTLTGEQQWQYLTPGSIG